MKAKSDSNKTDLFRFGVSLPHSLIVRFDKHIQKKDYPNRSEAIRDLIRKTLIEEKIDRNEVVIGVLHILFNHHKHDLMEKLTDVQHDYHHLIISSTHVHLNHESCLEVILLKGKTGEIKNLSDKMIATKGVIHGQLFLTSQGKYSDKHV